MKYLIVFFLFIFPRAYADEIMSLKSFIKKIKTDNSAYQSYNINKTAAHLKFYEARLLTAPHFFVNADVNIDKSPVLTPSVEGTQRDTAKIQMGVQMQTDFGLNGKMYVGEVFSKINGADSTLVPPDNSKFNLQNYGVELQLPLLRKGFGRDIRLKKESILNSSEASAVYAQIDELQLENKATLVYLKLAKYQEIIKLQKLALNEEKSLVNWTQERVNTKILEVSDLLQAEAALQSCELNLQSSLISLSDTQKDFNALLGQDAEKPLPQLEALEKLVPNTNNVNTEAITRRDIKALTKTISSEQANILVQNEDFKPELNIVAKAVGFTKQSNTNDTARCSEFQDCSQLYLGVTLEIPLDFVATQNSLAGTENSIRAKKLNLENAQKESLADSRKLFQSSAILQLQRNLSHKLMETQKLRLTQERKRQKLGLSSTFDVIRAEQDFSESQIKYLSIIYSQAELTAQLKLFEVEK